VNPALRTAESHDAAEGPVVLVVEDEALIRMVVADYLRDCGYHVVAAGNGDEAIAVLKTDMHIDVMV
jgi:CheY-like chemotaxis protein